MNGWDFVNGNQYLVARIAYLVAEAMMAERAKRRAAE